jgi:hypothetical protein
VFNFAVFNVADASISTGVAVLVIGVWIKDRNEPEALPESDLDNDDKGSSDRAAPGFGDDNKIIRESLSEEHWGD